MWDLTCTNLNFLRKWQARGTVVILFDTLDMYNMVYVVVGHETATKGFGHVQYRF